MTWNETLFPSGFPALGEYIHGLGLLFGVYEDAGIRSCQTNIEQAGSLCKSRALNNSLSSQEMLISVADHESQDAALFTSWKIDALKCK